MPSSTPPTSNGSSRDKGDDDNDEDLRFLDDDLYSAPPPTSPPPPCRRRRRRRRRLRPRHTSLVLSTRGQELRLEVKGAADCQQASSALLGVAAGWNSSLNTPRMTTVVLTPPPTTNAPAPFSSSSRGVQLRASPSFCTSDWGSDDATDKLSLEDLGRLTKDEREHVSSLSVDDCNRLCAAARSLSAATKLTPATPLRFRVLASALPLPLKRQICTKLERFGDSGGQSSEVPKYTSWVEACLALPFGKLAIPSLAQPMEQILRKCRAHLDSVVYGHRAAKQAVLERVFCWYTNPHAPQRPLAFCGVPGNGKTTLAKQGIGPLLGRPVNFVSLGGAHDCSTLIGHGYTFEASQPGRIVESLCSSSCMNPVIYFDELDKLSDTPKGEEISNVLVHLTDTTQNDAFRDRFLNGVDLDMSRALLVFSFNEIQRVPRVLLDRMQVVQMEPFSHHAQREVVNTFLFPQAIARSGASKGTIHLEARAVDALLERVDTSTGLRSTLDVLDQLVTKACIWLQFHDSELTYPLSARHFSGDNNNDTCVISAEAVSVICSEIIGTRHRNSSSMYV